MGNGVAGALFLFMRLIIEEVPLSLLLCYFFPLYLMLIFPLPFLLTLFRLFYPLCLETFHLVSKGHWTMSYAYSVAFPQVCVGWGNKHDTLRRLSERFSCAHTS